MPRKRKSLRPEDLSPEILRLVDRWVHGYIGRRQFLEESAEFLTGGLAVAAVVEAFTPEYALGQQVAVDDTRIHTEYLPYPSPDGHQSIRGYWAAPANAAAALPGIICIHGGQGLYAHHEDIARRMALANFVAFAPDALSPLGGHPGDRAEAQRLMSQLDVEQRIQDFVAAVGFLKAHPSTNGRVGIMGFCWGGGMVNTLATRIPDLDAAVSYYGGQPEARDVVKINAPLMLHYAGLDERVNAGWPAYEAALKATRKDYTMHMYEGAQHAFNNDTDTVRYNQAAADLAWQRTLEFFDRHLR